MSKFVVNVNGELFDEGSAKISVFDRGFLYGDSVYEATRTFNKNPFRLHDHLDRLFLSAAKIDLDLTISRLQIEQRVQETIAASPYSDALLRIILTRGTNADLGLDPGLSGANNLIIITKAIEPNPEWWLKEGLSLIFYDKKTIVRGSLPKSGNYRENILAHKLARSLNAYDAIMVNDEGHVTECTTSNIWIIKKGIGFTPPLKDGVLEGLTRRTLLEMAQSGSIPLVEKSLTRGDILKAEECFISSTTRNLVPVTKVEGITIGSGIPGPMTLQLLERYLSFVRGK